MSKESVSQSISKHSIPKFPSSESFLLKDGMKRSEYEEYTPKVLPPCMKQLIQENTSNVLRKIRSQLKEFATFVEDMQLKSYSDKTLLIGSSSQELKTSSESITKGPVQAVDPRPKNAPLRDAFQMVLKLFSRISNIIDQVAANISAEDDHCRDVQSPHYDYYYSQYVFQLTCYILQTISEELESFSKILAEVSVDEALSKLPANVDEVDMHPSRHNLFPNKSKIFGHSEAPRKVSRISSEDTHSSSTSSSSVSNVELKKQAKEALTLLTFLSKEILHYFHEHGSTEFDEMQQKEFSKVALGIPDLCKGCSKKVARKLRRYTSRENLFEEKYQKESDEMLFLSESHQKKKGGKMHFNTHIQGSYMSDSKAKDLKATTNSQANFTSVLTGISDGGVKMIYKKSEAPLKSPSHWEPLIRGQVKDVSLTNQMKRPDDKILRLISVTEGSGEREKFNFNKDIDQIQFNIQEFCSLLKEKFRQFLSQESKNDTKQSETADSIVIGNILIQCFREASKNVSMPHSSFRFDISAHGSRAADGKNNENDTKPNEESALSGEEQIDQLNEAVDKFLKNTYQIAITALKEKKAKETQPSRIQEKD